MKEGKSISKFLKRLAKKEILVPHIDAYLGRAEFPDLWNFPITPNKTPDTHFHPSGDCTPCERTLFAKFSGELEGKAHTASSHKNFMVGHFWHILLSDILVELDFANPKAVEHKLKYTDPVGWTVSGAADVSRCYVPGHAAPFLVDFKTMNARMFAEPPPPYILDKWTAQVNIYMDLLRKLEEPAHPERCIMVVIQKDTPHNFKEVIIDYDPDLVGDIYDKWDTVWGALEEDVPPKCDCPIGKCPVEALYSRA